MLKIFFPVIIMILILFTGCKKDLSPINYIPPPLPDDMALYLSIDGNNPGLWILNANDFNMIDSMHTGRYGPGNIELSTDYNIFYSIWGTRIAPYTKRYDLYSVDLLSMDIINSMNINHRFLANSQQEDILLTYGDGNGLGIYNRDSFSLLHSDTTLQSSMLACPSANESIVYMAYVNFSGIVVYDLKEFKTEYIIPVADSVRRVNMYPADMVISLDGNFLFLTVFNWVSGGGYGSFFVVNLETKQVVGEYGCGSFSQMGISPDGKTVYISDPAGYTRDMLPTNKIWKYDIYSHSFSIFIDGLKRLKLSYYFITYDIVVATDNRTIFTTVSTQSKEGNDIHILKLDAMTGRRIGQFSLPRDHRGYVTDLIYSLKLSKYPIVTN